MKEAPRKACIASATRAARDFVGRRFPDSVAAVLFGSAARGDLADSSDLDILIVERKRIVPCHLHFQESDWCFDVMCRSLRFCTKRIHGTGKRWNHRDPDRILLLALAEGIELKDDAGAIPELKQRASLLLAKGPVALTAQEISDYRQLVTEALDDFVDAKSQAEAWFVAYHTVIEASHLLFGYNRQWSDGECKWIYRRMRSNDHKLAGTLMDGLERYRQTNDRAQLVAPVESILNLVGGRLYRDELNSNYPVTRAQQLFQDPATFTRKALRRVFGA
ncbi:MAG: nucleotidyltransferase domain-containing protein [Candidatus Binataceae bacterium]